MSKERHPYLKKNSLEEEKNIEKNKNTFIFPLPTSIPPICGGMEQTHKKIFRSTVHKLKVAYQALLSHSSPIPYSPYPLNKQTLSVNELC